MLSLWSPFIYVLKISKKPSTFPHVLLLLLLLSSSDNIFSNIYVIWIDSLIPTRLTHPVALSEAKFSNL